MDMLMPGLDGAATTRAILEHYPDVRVIALTSFDEGGLVEEALQAGAISYMAISYMLKDAAIDELADAIRLASAGQSTLAPAAAQALAQAAVQPPEQDFALTQRQLEVLALIAKGRAMPKSPSD
jgi:DNA-binding NarL/FixJ family response regulator